MKIISTLIFTILFAGHSLATEITVLNAGSKTGSFAQQSTAYADDLTQAGYNVTLDIPGNHCLAINKFTLIDGPVLMPWASDYEAGGRMGEDCTTFSFDASDIIRYNRTSIQACTLNSTKDVFDNGSGKIGVTTPKWLWQRTINIINHNFGTTHTQIDYNGSGDLRTALLNGEVDFAFLSPKHAKKVIAQGAMCFYTFGDSTDSIPSIIDMVHVNDKKFMYLGYDQVWLALNMSDTQKQALRSEIIKYHNTTGTATNNYSVQTIDWSMPANVAKKQFETSVFSLME